MCRACSKHGEKRNACKVLVESQKKRDHYDDIGIGGWIMIKMDLREIGWSRMDWIQPAQDMGQLWALVNRVINLWFP